MDLPLQQVVDEAVANSGNGVRIPSIPRRLQPPLMPDINTKKDLDDLVKAEKSRAVGEMLIIRGETQTCKVKIGSAVRVRL